MNKEEARKNLPDWLISSAVLGRHRGMETRLEELNELTQNAYRVLGDEEYSEIYRRVVEEMTGEKIRC